MPFMTAEEAGMGELGKKKKGFLKKRLARKAKFAKKAFKVFKKVTPQGMVLDKLLKMRRKKKHKGGGGGEEEYVEETAAQDGSDMPSEMPAADPTPTVVAPSYSVPPPAQGMPYEMPGAAPEVPAELPPEEPYDESTAGGGPVEYVLPSEEEQREMGMVIPRYASRVQPVGFRSGKTWASAVRTTSDPFADPPGRRRRRRARRPFDRAQRSAELQGILPESLGSNVGMAAGGLILANVADMLPRSLRGLAKLVGYSLSAFGAIGVIRSFSEDPAQQTKVESLPAGQRDDDTIYLRGSINKPAEGETVDLSSIITLKKRTYPISFVVTNAGNKPLTVHLTFLVRETPMVFGDTRTTTTTYTELLDPGESKVISGEQPVSSFASMSSYAVASLIAKTGSGRQSTLATVRFTI